MKADTAVQISKQLEHLKLKLQGLHGELAAGHGRRDEDLEACRDLHMAIVAITRAQRSIAARPELVPAVWDLPLAGQSA